jgi:hypothetical protein
LVFLISPERFPSSQKKSAGTPSTDGAFVNHYSVSHNCYGPVESSNDSGDNAVNSLLLASYFL